MTVLKQPVVDCFFDFNTPMEGYTTWMYLDVKGLVTTGVGNLIDPVQYSTALPWKVGVGHIIATKDQVVEEWNKVKSLQQLRLSGGGAFAAQTNLRLSKEDVRELVANKLLTNAQLFQNRFKQFKDFCADAQLGIMSMCWAMGTGFNFPAFLAYMKSESWALAAKECEISTKGNPGVKPRNERNKILFTNAHVVKVNDLDPAKLYWPQELGRPRPVHSTEYPTKDDEVKR